MSNAFDPYYKWLGISPAEQPPNHYRLLGITLYESNSDVISNAADRQMAHIRTFQSGKYSQESQKLLNELSAARVVLLDPEKRAAYETQLRAKLFTPVPGYPMGMNPMSPQAPLGMNPIPPQVPLGMNPMPPQVPLGMNPMPPQVPLGMNPMPPQAPMGMNPMPPQAPMGIGPQPPVPPQSPLGVPLPPAVGARRHKKTQQNNSGVIYAVIGGAILLILLCAFLFSRGGGKQTAQTEPQTETPKEDVSEINPDEFNYEAEAIPNEVRTPQGNSPEELKRAQEAAEAAAAKKDKSMKKGISEGLTSNSEAGRNGHSEDESGDAFDSSRKKNRENSLGVGENDENDDEKGVKNRTGKRGKNGTDDDSENAPDSDGISDENSAEDSDGISDASKDGSEDESDEKETGSSSEESGDDADSGTGKVSGKNKSGTSKKHRKSGASENDSEDSGSEGTADSEKADSEKGEKGSEVTADDIRKLGAGAALRLDPKRNTMLKFYGGSAATQTAVSTGVEWLMDKQIKDKEHGWWCFDHTLLPNSKRRHGSKNLLNAGLAKDNLVSATSLALMAVVGAGDISPKDKANVLRSIKFLQFCAKPASDQLVALPERESVKKIEASLVVEDNLYEDFHPHAWGTIAVCDYVAQERAKTEKRDKQLASVAEFAQALLRHICRQQNTDGGFPMVERGLTVDFTLVSKTNQHLSSVESTVWNLLAMKAGKEAGLSIPNENILKATEFLTAKVTQASRVHKDFAGISSAEMRDLRTTLFGVQILGNEYPTYAESTLMATQILKLSDVSQLQNNFFSTLYMRDLRGQTWESWRDTVLAQYQKEQSTDKYEAGSWFYDGEKINSEGGRLYCTAFVTLILEGYYRFEPLRPLEEYETSMEATLTGDANTEEMAPAFPIARPARNDGENAVPAAEKEEKEPEEEAEPMFNTDFGNE